MVLKQLLFCSVLFSIKNNSSSKTAAFSTLQYQCIIKYICIEIVWRLIHLAPWSNESLIPNTELSTPLHLVDKNVSHLLERTNSTSRCFFFSWHTNTGLHDGIFLCISLYNILFHIFISSYRHFSSSLPHICWYPYSLSQNYSYFHIIYITLSSFYSFHSPFITCICTRAHTHTPHLYLV